MNCEYWIDEFFVAGRRRTAAQRPAQTELMSVYGCEKLPHRSIDGVIVAVVGTDDDNAERGQSRTGRNFKVQSATVMMKSRTSSASLLAAL